MLLVRSKTAKKFSSWLTIIIAVYPNERASWTWQEVQGTLEELDLYNIRFSHLKISHVHGVLPLQWFVFSRLTPGATSL